MFFTSFLANYNQAKDVAENNHNKLVPVASVEKKTIDGVQVKTIWVGAVKVDGYQTTLVHVVSTTVGNTVVTDTLSSSELLMRTHQFSQEPTICFPLARDSDTVGFRYEYGMISEFAHFDAKLFTPNCDKTGKLYM